MKKERSKSMPQAKLHRGQRITKAVPSAKKRKKKDGRPKGTLKKRKFYETKLGFMLKYEARTEYDLIIENTQKGENGEPLAIVIDSIARGSRNPILKGKRFKNNFDEYKKLGLYVGYDKVKRITPEVELYYQLKQKKKLEKFIECNKQRIKALNNKSKIIIGI